MEREELLALIKQHVKRKNLIKHMLACEAIMRAVARELGEDEGLWALTGLVHDIDFEECKEDGSDHGQIAQKILKGKVPEETLRAILSHNYEKTGVQPKSKMEIAFLAVDAITGLIVATALVKPDKKLSSVTVDSVKHAFKKKGFAAGSDRNHIKVIEKIGIPLERFYEISLKAMQSISDELGL